MPLIEVSELSKTFQTFSRREGVAGSFLDLFHREYRTLIAVDAISFNVEQGELLGYIGPNGAGKSTSIKMLTGILKPTSGRMKVIDFDPYLQRKTYTKHIGVVFGQRTQLWWDIAVIESLKLLAKIYDVTPVQFKDRLATLDEILGLKDLLHTPVRKLSLGQRIRCDMAASLLHNPPVLFLDEPTIGLDAVGKDAVRGFLRRINKEFKTTIILTTHDLNEIEELCKRIVVLDKGKILFDGSLASIKKLPGLKRRLQIDFPGTASVDSLKHKFGEEISAELQGERRVLVAFDPGKISTVELIKELVSTQEITDFTLTEPDIEEVIMKIYKGGIA